jgi:hypothetical protein
MPGDALQKDTGGVRANRTQLIWAYAVLLFALNVYVAHRLFTLEYSAHLESNEGTFYAISRIMAAHPTDLLWFPYWDAGMPFQNTYLPLLHALVAIFSRLTGYSTARGFHAVSGFFYCLGPVTLFLMAAGISRRIGYSFVASLLYSLTSPSSMLIPLVARDAGGIWNARRLQILGFYGEGPHITTVALLPLAVLLLHLALQSRRPRDYVLTGLLMAGVVLSNAFGAVDLAIMTACLLATIGFERLGRNLFTTIAIGACTYLFISPSLPPTLLRTIQVNSRHVDGDFSFSTRTALGFILLGAGFLALWWLTRRWKVAEPLRFFVLFAFVISGIPLLFLMFGIAVFPQAHRYHMEMEMGLCLAVTFAAALALDHAPRRLRVVLATVLLIFSVWQTIHYVRYARRLILPIDITTTIPYRAAMFMKQHDQAGRVMVAGSSSYLLNAFIDTPQLHGGHDPNSPNFENQVAVFVIQSGMNTGSRDAEISLLWLKAFGAQSIMVPGPTSIEYQPPFANPHKFDGVLPVLWNFEDTKIYRVPNRSSSLAHVVPAQAIVSQPPVNGLDVDQIYAYDAALDDASYPAAEIQWHNLHSFHVAAKRQPGQVISVQVTYHPGWHAIERGRAVPITRDGLGLMVLKPDCQGDCSIEMRYDGGLELKFMRILSAMAACSTLIYCAMSFHKGRWTSLRRD